MFGSTIKLIGSDLAKFGVESSFVSQTDLKEWQAAVRPNTRLLFAETPTNPLTEVCDIQALADIAHNAGALFAVDNCFATPSLQRPVAMGADIIMHSGTKYLDGQGRVMAGALVRPAANDHREVFARAQKRRHDARALQRLGGAQGPWKPWTCACVRKAPVRKFWPNGWKSTPPWRACITPVWPVTRSTTWPCARCRAWAARSCPLK
jgi:hypothetical protein